MKMVQTECYETLAYKIQTPGIYLEESIQHQLGWRSFRTTFEGEYLEGRNSYWQNIQYVYGKW